ncbi:succinylglutamate desuccinylase/aspartoacylase domain-containing protein [Rhodopila sp.]|uniref:succinylglutamate desuccinylase/aspartoacylase domain-containing protein n=1 Tax=Rhodopila sp. TaxID=2480087 RepID=UPI002BA99473|nr:succinylglutamate desuccinylase/aspartoacylase family protein [Rhodopila sp.]HVZ08446.1 succinylglutamate desuccinylase/aspartoacylase family protein [Rhodopila sp.]
MTLIQTQAPLPEFQVDLPRPDITPWIVGNTGIAGFTTLDSDRPGPHVAVLCLTHGNEFAGAIVVDELLRAQFKPLRGRLSLGFVNLTAFARFDPKHPTASRFIDEDLNRVWDDAILKGPRRSIELDRAREIRPFIETADILVDLHSMLWASEPLILCGTSARGKALAMALETPTLVIADKGHVNGRRLIDYARFIDPRGSAAACLVEAGQHWETRTVDTMRASVAGLLRHFGMTAGADAPLPPSPATVGACSAPRFAQVTAAVTAVTSQFTFVQAYHGGDVIAARNTLIAMDGDIEIRTPYDNCLLVMPSLRPSRGHTAVRLARFET